MARPLSVLVFPILGVTAVNVGLLRAGQPAYQTLADWLAVPTHCYIGRNNHYVGVAASKWHNPYSLKKCGSREAALAAYETYVRQGPLWEQLIELEGKRLGCWCHTHNSGATAAKPYCHGDILIKLFNEKFGVPL